MDLWRRPDPMLCSKQGHLCLDCSGTHPVLFQISPKLEISQVSFPVLWTSYLVKIFFPYRSFFFFIRAYTCCLSSCHCGPLSRPCLCLLHVPHHLLESTEWDTHAERKRVFLTAQVVTTERVHYSEFHLLNSFFAQLRNTAKAALILRLNSHSVLPIKKTKKQHKKKRHWLKYSEIKRKVKKGIILFCLWTTSLEHRGLWHLSVKHQDPPGSVILLSYLPSSKHTILFLPARLPDESF